MQKNDTILGRRLRSLIKYRQISQKELASTLSIAVSTLNGYIMGYRSPDYYTLRKIADKLMCNFDYLLNEIPLKINTEVGRSYLLNLATENKKTLLDISNFLKIDYDILLGYYNYQFNLNKSDIVKIAEYFNTSVEFIQEGCEIPKMISTKEQTSRNSINDIVGVPLDTTIKDDEVLMLAKNMKELQPNDFELLKNLVLSMRNKK